MTSLRGASGDRQVFPGIPVYGKAPYPRVAAVRGLNRPPVALVAAGRLGVSLPPPTPFGSDNLKWSFPTNLETTSLTAVGLEICSDPCTSG